MFDFSRLSYDLPTVIFMRRTRKETKTKKNSKNKAQNAGCMHKRCLTIIPFSFVFIFIFLFFFVILLSPFYRCTAEFYYLFHNDSFCLKNCGSSIGKKKNSEQWFRLNPRQNGIDENNQCDELKENNSFVGNKTEKNGQRKQKKWKI